MLSARAVVIAFAIFVLALAAANPKPDVVGDGVSYWAMADNVSRFKLPSFSAADVDRVGRNIDPERRSALLEILPADDGRFDTQHFWLYSALAAPFVGMARLVGASPYWGFALLNAGLLLLAVAILARRLRWPALVLVCAGPVIWWIDKAHTEIFTFALLAIAFAFIRDRPGWSIAALGLASTQNPPIALAIPFVAAINWRTLKQPDVWRPGAAGVALALLHPLYYLPRLGVVTPSALTSTESHAPSLSTLWAFLGDLNIGVFPSFPPYLIVGVAVLAAMLLADRRALLRPEILVLPPIALLWLISFAQNVNLNNGGTPGMTRYAMWLIPLAIPILRQLDATRSERPVRWLAPAAALSVLWALFTFHPARPENYLEPSSIASYVWENHPGWNKPLTEVFHERLTGEDFGEIGSIATANCAKVLVVDDYWPEKCRGRGQAPNACADYGDRCYANWDGERYSFTRAPSNP